MRQIILTISTLVLAAVFSPIHTDALAQEFCALGSVKDHEGCRVSCTTTWNGGNCPQHCVATVPVGFILLGQRIVSHSGHGDVRYDVIAGGQRYKYVSDIRTAYDNAIRAAAKKGRKSLAGSLREQRKSEISQAQFFESSHPAVRLEVNAARASGASAFNQISTWRDASIVLTLKCAVPTNMSEQLYKMHGLR